MRARPILSATAFCVMTLFLFCTHGLCAEGHIEYNYKTEGINRYVLDNGLVLLIREVHDRPIVAVDLFLRAGLSAEGEKAGSGISHLLEHMIFKGTAKRGPGEIDRQIRSKGGDTNGFTSNDYTGYTITIPSKYALFALEVLEDAVFNPAIDPEEFEREKGVVMNEVRLNEDSPERSLNRLLFSTTYTTHIYRYPVIGYEDRLNGLTRDDVLAYHEKNYTPENMVLSIVGDIEAGEMLREVKGLFQGHPRSGTDPAAIRQEPLQLNTRVYEKYYDTGQTHLSIAFHSVELANKDLYALDLLSMILGDGDISILNKKLREEEKIVYGISAYNYTPQYPGLFVISALLDHENRDKVLSSIMEALEGVKSGDLPDELIESSKNKAIARHVFENEGVSSISSRMGIDELTAHDPGFSTRYRDGVVSVKKEDIARVANQYLNAENMTIASLIPKSEENGEEAPRIAEKSGLPIESVTLKNGLKALIKRDGSLPIVHIGVYMKGGLLAESDKDSGISNMTVHMLDKGTSLKSRGEIADFIESKGAALGLYSQNNSFGISIKLLKDDIDTGLELLKELVSSPSFPEPEIEQLKNEIKAAIRSEDKDIFATGSNLLKEKLFKVHPYRLRKIGNAQSVENLKRDDIIKFHDKYYVASNMVLTVFGDLEPLDIKNKIEKAFSDIPGGKPLFNDKREGAQKSIREERVKMDKEQALCMIGFHSADIMDKDRYTLEIISTLVSGGGSRLFTSIRDEKGLAYTLGGYQVSGPLAGYFVFYAATAPDAADAVKSYILEEVSGLRDAYLSDEELRSAKNNLMGKREMELETLGGESMLTGLDELYGLGFKNYTEYERHIESVTKEDVRRVSRKYFDPKRYSSVIVLPDGTK